MVRSCEVMCAAAMAIADATRTRFPFKYLVTNICFMKCERVEAKIGKWWTLRGTSQSQCLLLSDRKGHDMIVTCDTAVTM